MPIVSFILVKSEQTCKLCHRKHCYIAYGTENTLLHFEVDSISESQSYQQLGAKEGDNIPKDSGEHNKSKTALI